MLEKIEVTIPARIAELEFDLPGETAEALDTAARAIASLDAADGPVLSALSGLLLRTESVASSKIENISASVDDYARALHGSQANSSASSMVAASQAMENLVATVTASRNIEFEDLLAAHRLLMANEPGEERYAGRIRDVQNWVGGSDYSPRGALFVPPPPDLLDPFVADLMAFANRRDLPSLVQATIAHAQFETLHPFTDGNGRIGRALVNAILRARGTTSSVVVPMASALVAWRDAYFSALNSYRSGDLGPIVDVFASAASVASDEARVTAARLRELTEQWLADLGRSRRGSAPRALMDYLPTHPVLSATDIEDALGLGTSVTYTAIERLEAAGILRPLTDRKRNQVWGASAILDELSDLDARIQLRARSARAVTYGNERATLDS